MNDKIQHVAGLIGLGVLLSGCDEDKTSGLSRADDKRQPDHSLQYQEALAEGLKSLKEKEAQLDVDFDLTTPNWTNEDHEGPLSGVNEPGKFGTFQGNVLLRLKIAAEKEIERRCSIVHIDRSRKGDLRIQFDFYERLSPAEVEEQVNVEWEVFEAMGMTREAFERARSKVGIWLAREEDDDSSSASIFHKGEKVKVGLQLFQFFERSHGTMLRYTFEAPGTGEADWERSLKNGR